MDKDILLSFAKNPTDDSASFQMALQYEKLNQYASAFSLFLRTAEFSRNDDLVYESLIKAAKMIRQQSRRDETEECMLRHAISVYPQYSEAYFLLSNFFRRKADHKSCRTYAEIAIEKKEFNNFLTDVGYPGKAGILYEKAVAEWNTGLYERARETVYKIKHHYKLADHDKQLVYDTINQFGYPNRAAFDKDQMDRFKFKFPGLSNIKENFSKHMQDIFILTATNGKTNGTYLEIGSHDPFINNNTYLLEKQYGWKGVSIDLDQDACNEFKKNRINPVLCDNAIDVDYARLLNKYNMPNDIDYLQVDVDEYSCDVLDRIPFDQYRFSIIHFEHDRYRFGDKYLKYSHEVLSQRGYVLAVNNIAYCDTYAHEDWWIHPDLIDYKSKSLISNKQLNNVMEYFYAEPTEA